MFFLQFATSHLVSPFLYHFQREDVDIFFVNGGVSSGIGIFIAFLYQFVELWVNHIAISTQPTVESERCMYQQLVRPPVGVVKRVVQLFDMSLYW